MDSLSPSTQTFLSKSSGNTSETVHNGDVAKLAAAVRRDSSSDVLLLDWDGPNDSLNPLNWPNHEKWVMTVIVSLFAFVSSVASVMNTPATPQIGIEFGVTSTTLQAMITSIYLLGFAFGPMVLCPLSELYGRVKILQLSCLFFLAWNIGCSFSQTKNQLIAFRLLAGLGGSAPLTVGNAVIGDIWRTEERGKAIAVYSLAPLLGPVLGPVCGSWMAERTTWRWVFRSTSIVDAIIQVLGLFYLKECYAPYLLERKAKRLMATLDHENGTVRQVQTVYERSGSRHWKHVFANALIRPFAFFVHEPIIQLLGLYMAVVYGVYYIFLTMTPTIFTVTYKMSVGVAGLHYLSMGIGLVLASSVNATSMDKIYIWLKKRRGNGFGEPEFRLPCMVPGTIYLPAGLFLAGWAAQRQFHWIVTDIGMALIAASMIVNYQIIQVYVVDAFPLYSASALAAVSFLRSVAGFGFPLFAPAMYDKLDYGLANTVLACISIVLGCPGPFLFWFYGKKIRMMSRYNIDERKETSSASEHLNGDREKSPFTKESM